MRICKHCNNLKNPDEFWESYPSKCIECKSAQNKEYSTRTNYEKIRYNKDIRKNRIKSLSRYYSNYHIPGEKERRKNVFFKTTYGITLDKYKEMLILQNYKCLLCNKEHLDENKKRLHVDHCHKTGNVRGLLCANCNAGIGFLKEDINIMKKAIEYLEKNVPLVAEPNVGTKYGEVK